MYGCVGQERREVYVRGCTVTLHAGQERREVFVRGCTVTLHACLCGFGCWLGLVGFVWCVWFGLFGLVGLVWLVWFGLFSHCDGVL